MRKAFGAYCRLQIIALACLGVALSGFTAGAAAAGSSYALLAPGDIDDDGIPDWLDPVDDRTPTEEPGAPTDSQPETTPDADNDGIPNELDPSDNDAPIITEDPDKDNDGIPNELDPVDEISAPEGTAEVETVPTPPAPVVDPVPTVSALPQTGVGGNAGGISLYPWLMLSAVIAAGTLVAKRPRWQRD